MRRVVAILLSLLLVVHTALAGAASAPCCIEDCPASASCTEGMCAGCAPLGTMPTERATEVTAPGTADSVRQDHPAPGPVLPVWTPPD